MTTRYEVVDGEIVKICEERTSYSLASSAALLNQKTLHMQSLDERMAKLGAQLKQAREGWSNTGNDLAVRDGQLAEAKARIAELEGKLDYIRANWCKTIQEERDEYKARIDELEAQIVAMCAKDGTETAQPSVTPEWLARAFRDALIAENSCAYELWDHCPQEIRNRYLHAAKSVLDQMPKQESE